MSPKPVFGTRPRLTSPSQENATRDIQIKTAPVLAFFLKSLSKALHEEIEELKSDISGTHGLEKIANE